MKKDVELAKKLLEGKGYKVSKKMNESEYSLRYFVVGQDEYDNESLYKEIEKTGETIYQDKRSGDWYLGDKRISNRGVKLLQNDTRFDKFFKVRESKKMNESNDGGSRVYDLVQYCWDKGIEGDRALNIICRQLDKEGISYDKDAVESKMFMYFDEIAANDEEMEYYDESKKMNEAGGHGWMKNHPSFDPIGAPAPEDKDIISTSTPEELKAQGAVQASEVKAGDTIQADFDASEIDLGEFYTVEEILDDGEGMGDLTFVCDNGQKLHFDRDDFVGFKVDPKDIPAMRKSRAKYDLKSYESKNTNESAPVFADSRTSIDIRGLARVDQEELLNDYAGAIEYKDGVIYADETTIRQIRNDWDLWESKEEVLKPQYESEDLKYVSNVNGYSTYRKIENGKGVWFAKRQDDPDDKMFPISYEQARGFKEMPDETEIERLQREMGDMLLPKNEGLFKKKSKAGDQMRDLAKSAQKDVDDIKSQMEKFKKLNKKSNESKEMRESTDDRQQRRIVKNIADEVIRSRGENNSTGTYDEFIRKMVRNWATSGQDREFIKAAIEKSFDKEFSMKESSDTPHTESYKGYSIQSYDDFGATVYKNGKKVQEFENIGDAREYIDGLKESAKTLRGALLSSLKRLHESSGLDYEDLQSSNPSYVAHTLAQEYPDATEEELKSEIAKIVTKDYRFLSLTLMEEDDEELVNQKIEEISQEILKRVLREIEWDKESRSKDPMNGHKYQVGGSTPNVTETGTDYDVHDGGYKEDPREAIIAWLQLSQEAPTMVSIDTNKNAHAEELLNWVVDNEEEFRELCQEYKSPYKIDYLVSACMKGRTHDFDKSKYHYPDQIYPFALG